MNKYAVCLKEKWHASKLVIFQENIFKSNNVLRKKQHD